jgi:hypothetical protein
VKILPNNVKQAEFIRTVWAATPEHGTALADVLDPEYWVHIASQFKPNDRIEIIPVSGEWFAELHVKSSGPSGLGFSVLRKVEFDAPVAADPKAEFTVAYAAADKWRVTRNADSAVVARGLTSRAAGDAWIAANSNSALV